jgi:hypothetical protein
VDNLGCLHHVKKTKRQRFSTSVSALILLQELTVMYIKFALRIFTAYDKVANKVALSLSKVKTSFGYADQ